MNRLDYTLAQDRARRLYRSRGFQRAYLRGAVAASDGKPASTCPYQPDPRKTWLKVWRSAWLRGYASIKA